MLPVLTFRRVRYDDPVAAVLVAQVQQEYVERYGGPDATPLAADYFQPPDGAFFVGLLDGVPVATGAWRFRPDLGPGGALGGTRAAEVKRMFVVRSHRRLGLARQVLAHLEDTARAAGADVLVLETGYAQPEAIALYESAGYAPVPGFGHYKDAPGVRYFGRRLLLGKG